MKINVTYLTIYLLIMAMMLQAISCGRGKYDLTATDKKMVAVLADVHIAEAGMDAIPDKSVKDSLANVWYGQIFTIHHIKKTDFEQYLEEIGQNTNRMNAVYEAVTEQLKQQGK